MLSIWRKWWIYPIVFVVLVFVLFAVFSSGSDDAQDVSLSDFLSDVQTGRVTRVEVDGRTVTYEIEGLERSTRLERDDTVREVLSDAGISPTSPDYPTIVTQDRSGFQIVIGLLIAFLPLFIIGGGLYLIIRQLFKGQRQLPPTAVTNYDPVCRMSVNPSSSAGSSTFMTITYYFCSPEHKEQFDADPAKYLLQK